MSLSSETREKIETLLTGNPVVLFMKGSPSQPQCGFSAKASGILNSLVGEYAHINVLADPELREGIKVYGQWPTIPQLYIKGELVGGSDIIEQMLNSGELHQALGIKAPDRTAPTISISAAAAKAINDAMANQPAGLGLHLSIDARFNANFELKPATGNEIISESAGIKVHFDLASAQRANGLSIDWVEDVRGAGLAISNPNAPAQVKALSVEELNANQSAYTIIDVRPMHDRNAVAFPLAKHVLDESTMDELATLPKDTALAFLCHHGNSSRQAAEHFRSLGFNNVSNIEGGIDAWSQNVDSNIPRY